MPLIYHNDLTPLTEKGLRDLYEKLNKNSNEYKLFKGKLGSFIYEYFPHLLDSNKEYSKFRRTIHNKITEYMNKSHIVQVEAYRGASKSTTITNFNVLYETLTKRRHYVIIVSSTQSNANEELEKIADELLENDKLRNDFQINKVEVTVKNIYFTVGRGKRFIPNNKLEQYIILLLRKGYTFEELLLMNKDYDYKEYYGTLRKVYKAYLNEPFKVRIRGVGAFVKVRGTKFKKYRPDLIILDDVENDENVNNSLQRDKLYNYFTKAILKLPSRTAHRWNVLVIGTVLHFDGLISRVKNRKDTLSFSYPLVINYPNKMDKWQELANMDNREKALEIYKNNKHYYKEGVLLDNPQIDLFDVMMTYFEDIDSFNSEFQNIATVSNSGLSKYYFYEQLPDDLVYFLALDPADTQTIKSDYSGISIVGKSISTQKRYSIFNKGFKEKGLSLINLIIKLHKQYDFKIIAIESNFFSMFIDFMNKEALKYNINLPIKSINHNSNKEIRIESIGIDLELGDLLLNKDEVMLLKEIKEFPKGKNDDILDSLEMANSLSKSYLIGNNNHKPKPKPSNKLVTKIKNRRI